MQSTLRHSSDHDHTQNLDSAMIITLKNYERNSVVEAQDERERNEGQGSLQGYSAVLFVTGLLDSNAGMGREGASTRACQFCQDNRSEQNIGLGRDIPFGGASFGRIIQLGKNSCDTGSSKHSGRDHRTNTNSSSSTDGQHRFRRSRSARRRDEIRPAVGWPPQTELVHTGYRKLRGLLFR